MENNTIGFWNKRKEVLKEKFPTISDDDLSFSDGKEKEMMELLSYKLGKSEEELRFIVNSIKQDNY
jgi:hypothetical protein